MTIAVELAHAAGPARPQHHGAAGDAGAAPGVAGERAADPTHADLRARAPKRCDASAICVPWGSLTARAMRADCAIVTPGSDVIASTARDSSTAYRRADLSPSLRQPASVLAALKGAREAPAEGRL